jgi:glycosyltransferase involved in cell wall biosynthesis
MKTIAFDHIIFSLQRFGGISRWWIEHVKLFCENIENDMIHLGPYSDSHRPSLSGTFFSDIVREDRKPILWFLRDVKIDSKESVLFHGSYLRRPSAPKNSKFVFTFHDASGLRLRGLNACVKKIVTRLCIDAADAVTTMSHHGKRELLDVFPDIDPSKIIPLPMGFRAPQKIESHDIMNRLNDPFVLWVGNRHGYKNGALIWEALSAIDAVHLICVGGEPASIVELHDIAQFKLDKRVHFISGVSSEQLAFFYSGAVALWYPSLNEGFGIPPLEAAAQGCPVLAKSGHSVEEIAGDYCIFQDNPTSEWLAEETKFLLKSGQDPLLKKAGSVLIQKYSWERYFNQMLQLYADLGFQPNRIGT